LDSGYTWVEACRFLAYKYNIAREHLFFTDATNGWVLLSEGNGNRFSSRVYRTDDGGHFWSEHCLNISGSPEKMTFFDSKLGWVIEVQSNAARTQFSTGVHSTSDGGRNWVRASTLNGSLRDVAATENGDLFACGRNGFLARSSDAGRRWKVLDTSSRLFLNSIHFRGRVGIVVGTADFIRSKRSVAILATHDGGDTWKRIESPIRASLFGAYLCTWESGLMVSSESVYRFLLRY
jgi:photosystem II stability/assembly factor-like uncharacterized protein